MAEILDAQTNSFVIHIHKVWTLVIRKNSKINLETQSYWRKEKPSILKKKRKLSILIEWNWQRQVIVLTRTSSLNQNKSKWNWFRKKINQSMSNLTTRRLTPTGWTDTKMCSMRSIHSILSILFHLKVSPTIKKITMKNNLKSWKNTIKCYDQLVKDHQMSFVWTLILLKSLSHRQQIRSLIKGLSCNTSLKFKLKQLNQFCRRQCQLILIHSIRKNSFNIS